MGNYKAYSISEAIEKGYVDSMDAAVREVYFINKAWIDEYFSFNSKDDLYYSRDHIEGIIAKGGQVFLVIDKDEEMVVSTGAVVPDEYFRWDIKMLATKVGYKRMGAGEVVLEKIIRYARKHGANYIEFALNRKCVDAIEFCRRNGFRVVPLDNRNKSNKRINLNLELALFETCPCCGLDVVREEYDICKICGWENDHVQNKDENYAGGANKLSLKEYRKDFLKKYRSDPTYVWTGDKED